MRMPKTPSTAALEMEVADLQRRLERTQFQMLSLCGEQMAEHVDAWLYVHTIRDFDAWIDWLGKMAVDLVRRNEPRVSRVKCPMCGSSPFAANGFKLPLGLIRHVKGSHGQPQCVIAGAAQELALTEVRKRSDGKWRPLLRSDRFETEKPWAPRDDGACVGSESERLQSAEIIPLRRPRAADSA